MKYLPRYIAPSWGKIFFLLFCHFGLFSQGLKYYNGPFTVLDSVEGRAVYAYYPIDEDSIQFQGRFSFSSRLLLAEEKSDVRQLLIDGGFSRGLKNGSWNYELGKFEVQLHEIRDLKLKASLEGIQFVIKGNYRNGIPSGQWQTIRFRVEDSKQVGHASNSEIFFEDGIAKGTFRFTKKDQHHDFLAQGDFDDNGFFHGSWLLEYIIDSVPYLEKRQYNHGFLVELELFSLEDGKIADTNYILSFTDVKDKLLELVISSDSANFRKGEKSFGIEFNSGYRLDDPRIEAQKQGNSFLKSVFEAYDVKKSIIGAIAEPRPPIIRFTTRFLYKYPEIEDSIINVILKKTEIFKSEIDTFLNNPSLTLNRNKTDSLSKSYAYFQYAKKKVQRIEDLATRIQDGEFDFVNRAIYYENGVPGFQNADTIKYDGANGKGGVIIQEYPLYLNSSDDLVLNLHAYLEHLQESSKKTINAVEVKISILQKESQIAELDKKIVHLSSLIESLYDLDEGDSVLVNVNDLLSTFLKRQNEKSVLGNEMYGILISKHYNRLISSYSNEEDFEKKVERGNFIVDLLNAFKVVHPKLREIDRMPSQLDSAFTHYKEHPFDYRMMESKFLTGIYSRGAERLLPHLIDELKRFQNGNDVINGVSEIFALRDRLIELSKTDEDDRDVKRLNTRLRRENVPERIKRLLGL
ncbi:MAG: hypothetical protein JJU02_12245 [Cryomorphaceae bacterium]|nr:hypothetical protein [Cryomorphaceae bacterium]